MLSLITSLMGRSIGQDTILPAKMINHCKTLIPMGAGLVMAAPPLHLAAGSLTPPASAPDVWGGEMGAKTAGQAGAEESQTQQGAGRQATAQPRGSDGQEAMPGKRRGQALCDALWH